MMRKNHKTCFEMKEVILAKQMFHKVLYYPICVGYSFAMNTATDIYGNQCHNYLAMCVRKSYV